MIGGYKVLDLRGLDLTSAKEIPGIYSAVEASIDKPILVRNLKNNNIEIPAFFTTPFFTSESVFLVRTVTSGQIHRVVINSNDNTYYSIVNLGISSSPGDQAVDEPSASM